MRPSWEDYALLLAEAASRRADCKRRQVGAVILSPDNLVIGTGYNGTRSGALGCLAGGCPRGLLTYDQVAEFSDYNDLDSPGYCISTHAEPNAMLHASGPLAGCLIAVTDQPCEGCRKLIYNAGLARVIWPSGEYVFKETQ